MTVAKIMHDDDTRGADAVTVLPLLEAAAAQHLIADALEAIERGIATESRVAARFPLRAAVRLLKLAAEQLPAVEP